MESFSGIVADAKRVLDGLENGTLSAADCFTVADKLDPTIVYFIIRFLRDKYPAGDASSQGIMQRLLELTATYDSIVAATKSGEKDPVREWFDDTYNMREWYEKSDEFLELIVEKIEG